MLRRLRWLAAVAAVLIAPAAGATPIHVAPTPTETSPGAAHAGSLSIDASVLESSQAFDLASVGIDLENGLDFSTPSPADSIVVLDDHDPIRSGTYSFSLIPEPSTLLLLAAGLAALRFRAGR